MSSYIDLNILNILKISNKEWITNISGDRIKNIVYTRKNYYYYYINYYNNDRIKNCNV